MVIATLKKVEAREVIPSLDGQRDTDTLSIPRIELGVQHEAVCATTCRACGEMIGVGDAMRVLTMHSSSGEMAVPMHSACASQIEVLP